jgi:hypothetical protein
MAVELEKTRRSYGTGSLIVRTDSNGRKTWHGKRRVNGRQVMRALGSSLFNYAVDREWIAKNPARGVTLPENPDDVDELRFLEVHDVHDL